MRREQVERLYEQYGPALVAYGCAIARNRATAEDLVQQVFLKLLKAGSAEPENARAYLYRAVRNAALNSLRGAARETDLEPEQAWFATAAGAVDGAIHDALALQSALLALPPEQREVIVMHIWGGMTFEEIAGVMGIPANTAASRYRYGLAKLRARMQPRPENSYAAKE